MDASRISRALTFVALLVAAGLVVVLAVEKRALEREVATLQRRLVEPFAGLQVPSFETVTLDGQPARIGESSAQRRQLLLIFTTTCPYCERTLPAWAEFAAAADVQGDSAVEVYGVSLDSAELTRRYVEKHGIKYPVISLTDRKLAALYRTRSVPLTMVLDSAGRVWHARIGMLESNSMAAESVRVAARIDAKARTSTALASGSDSQR